VRSLVIAAAAAAIGVAVVMVSLARADEAAAPPAPKTLQEITIEGEVRLPEVLFITSRDVERPLDALAGYLVAEDSLLAAVESAPVHLHVVPTAAASPIPDAVTQEEPR